MDFPGYCQCDETTIKRIDDHNVVLSSLRIVPPLHHNCYYVRLRNALIPRAEREAIFAARSQSHSRGGRHSPIPALLISEHFSRIMDRFVARANAQARADVPEMGPERNRRFYANMRALIEERRMPHTEA